MGRFVEHTNPYAIGDSNVNKHADSGCHSYLNLDETPIANGNCDGDRNTVANFVAVDLHAHGNARATHFTTATTATTDITAAHIATATTNANCSITTDTHGNTSATQAGFNIIL